VCFLSNTNHMTQYPKAQARRLHLLLHARSPLRPRYALSQVLQGKLYYTSPSHWLNHSLPLGARANIYQDKHACKCTMCDNSKAGTCTRKLCRRAHESDDKHYFNILHAGHVKKAKRKVKPRRRGPKKQKLLEPTLAN
jgi:hypothetical protein